MLSKEEVLDIIAYCKEHRIKRMDRLAQLGIGEWSFYEARKRYLREESEAKSSAHPRRDKFHKRLKTKRIPRKSASSPAQPRSGRPIRVCA